MFFQYYQLMEKGKVMVKKILIFSIILLLSLCTFQIKTYAASIPLASINVTTSKDKIAPGEEVTVNIEFGTDLGAYTFDIAYDNNLFEYVRSEGGTENDDGSRVRVTFYDSTGGTSPRTNMSVIFKAKENLITTNPTEFFITGEGLANSDASQEYDDITTPIEKNITIEPNYEDYTISLEYEGNIIENEEKEIKLITSSSLGKNYDNVRLTAEVVKKPSDNSQVSLTAINESQQEIDLIQDGYGTDNGYSLGGQNVRHELNVKSLFSEVGDYTLKISLLDKDSSDQLIISQELNISVGTNAPVEDENGEENNNNNNNNNEENESNENIGNTDENINNDNKEENNDEELPKNLPKTGNTKYGYILSIIALLTSGYIVTKNYNRKK